MKMKSGRNEGGAGRIRECRTELTARTRNTKIQASCRCSSTVEHRFRKAGVVGSNPTIGLNENATSITTCGVLIS
jgi:hypothetical protein